MRKRLDEAAWGRFAERLARLLDGGVPLLEALAFLTARGSRKERHLTALLDGRLREGGSFSLALAAGQAPLMIQALVEVGEQSGDLAGSLFRSGESCKERARWRRESKQAMIYPFFVCGMLLVISLFLFKVVIPRFADMYTGMGVKVGAGTRMMISFAAVAPMLLGWIGLGELSLWLLFRYVGTPAVWRWVWDRAPVVRKWVLLDRTHEWSATLGLLLDGGLPLIQALDVQAQLPMRQENRGTCQRVLQGVLGGMTLGEALRSEPLDDLLLLSVQVAEVTGDLPRALLGVEREMASARKQMMDVMLRSLEPVLMIVAGGVVGVVSLFMLWPMLDLINTL